MVVVEGVLEAKGVGHRQLPVFSEALQRGGGLRRPAAAAGDHQRALARQQQRAQFAQRTRIAPGLHRLHARQRFGVHRLREHVFGQHQHHGAGPAVHGSGKGARHVFGNAARVVDAFHALRHAFGGRAEEGGVVDFLECLAVARLARHIADEQHHGCRVLECGVQADGSVGGTGAARHETHAGAAGELALRFGHESRTALLPVGDETDTLGMRVKAVEHGKVTFARDTEGMGHALGDEAFDEQVASDPGHLTLLTN
jgi:hypothetical protein